ncbi:hypothetical protein GQ53DRAFT_829978 [Thozetella sp. PMI_491]|nr:hypothetical protein GQ53DRAFT_829978 [Thozetella sp. PMI_491]
MDYTQHASYFAGAPAYHPQFMSMPPLTPSHSNSAGSEDFNTTSPPEVYDQFPNGLPHQHDQFQPNFDGYAPFNPQQSFPGPPTPPNQHPGVHGQPQPVQPIGADAADLLPVTKTEASEQSHRQGSNSGEDDEQTPAQSRRKAQNRAAQRAFRERKERHVKHLETRLQQLEAEQKQTTTENERLKREMQKMSTENEILRATQTLGPGSSPGANGSTPTMTGPMSYSPTDFYSNVLQNHANKTPSHRIVESEDGERLLAAGATWELIINHELFKQGLVDIGNVSERLKPQAKCDGQGPVFEERAIIEAIEESVASGSDELL